MTREASGFFRLSLHVLPVRLAICRLAPDAALPSWAAGPFVSLTRTVAELSIVCAESAVPEGVAANRGWRALAVAGPLDFSLTGVLASLAQPLAAAGISIFAISTYDTDYLLAPESGLPKAVEALSAAGHSVIL